MNSASWIFSVSADLNWEVELVLLLRCASVSFVYGVENGEDRVSEVVGLKHASLRMKS